jgi:general secretion pathway protein E
MGVEPYLLASSLLGVIAQRLVRVLCPDCKQPSPADDGEMKILRADSHSARPILYKPVGCPACNHRGFIGRLGIYELVALDDGLRQMIHDRKSEMQLEAYARQHSPSIREDGIRLVLEGRTSLDEVLRVTREDA